MNTENTTQELSKKEKYNLWYKRYYEINKEKIREKQRIYNKKFRENNKEKIKETNKRYEANNKEKRRQYTKKYVKQNAERRRIYQRENYHKRKTYTKQYNEIERKRYKTIPTIRLAYCLRARIFDALRSTSVRKRDRTEELLGCTISEVKQHIESQWLPGMSWDNHTIDGWHIDHIKPCAAFDLTDPIQQKQCFHYTNLRPLWAKDNKSKSSFHEGIKHYYPHTNELL
jgi:Fe2+ transport system protein B